MSANSAQYTKGGVDSDDEVVTDSEEVTESDEMEEEESSSEVEEEDPLEVATRFKEQGNKLFQQQKYKEAIAYYTRAIAAKSDVAAFYSNRAAAYGKQRQLELAIRDCDTAVEVDPTFVRALVRKATFLLRLGKTEQARDAVSKVTVRDPRSRDALDLLRDIRAVENAVALGKKLIEQKKYPECYQTVQHALKYAPSSAPLQVLQLKALRGKGLLDQAIQVSTMMVRDGLRSNDVLTERAHCFYLQNNFESAKKHLAEVLRADPDHRDSQHLLKRLRNLTKTKEKGNQAFKAGQWDVAIQAYTECLKFDPELKTFNAQLYCNRAAAQLKKRNYAAARQDCTYAIHLDSTYLKAYQRRAMCYEQLGELQKAVSDLHTTRTLLTQARQSTDEVDRKVQALNVRIKRANRKDFYKILGVSHSFTEQELSKAKRKKALLWHPDKWASKGAAEQAKATAMMKDVNEAYSVLSDPKKRRRYDAGEDDLDGPGHGHHGGMDADMFNMFFRGGGGMPFGRR